MDIIRLLQKIDSKMQINNREIFGRSIEEQKEFIKSIADPTDDFERSYFQYKSQLFLKNKNKHIFNTLSYSLYKALKVYYSKIKVNRGKIQNAVFFPDGKSDNIIPESIKNRYPNYSIEMEKKYSLTKADLIFLKNIEKRFKGEYLFLLKIMVKMARYSYQIQKNNPKALIVCNEYSFTSSLMTLYCESNNIKLINVMHGEKIFCISDSFFRFSECYVWDEFYIKLFCNLKADPTQFFIEEPQSLKLTIDKKRKKYDYTFYLQDETGENLNKLVKYMKILSNYGKKICVRPHPRYSQISEIQKKCGNEIHIEDGKTISLSRSLSETRCAVSFASTVLLQAFKAGIPVIIDDLTRPDEYLKLYEAEYIMLNYKHYLLSDVVKEKKIYHV